MGLAKVLVAMVLVTTAAANLFDSDTQENWISRLYLDKLKNYNKNSRPLLDPSKNITIHVGLAVIHVDLDDHSQTLNVNSWVFMTWMDEYLQWEPKEYVNIDRLHFDETDVWVPDIKLFNSADGSDAHPFDGVPILVDHRGRVYWFPPARLQVGCDVSLERWPKDEHVCEVRMGSWAHHGELVDVQLLDNHTEVIMSNYEPNNRWTLVKVAARRETTTLDDDDTFFNLAFTFTLRRNAKTTAAYVTQSVLAVIVLVLASYVMPLHLSLLRTLLHLFALAILIACFFTLYATLPANGGPVPLIVRYYAGTIILTTISFLATVILTTRGCCLPSASTSSAVGKKIAGLVSSTPVLRNVVGSNANNYNHLEPELIEDTENPQTLTQMTEDDPSARVSSSTVSTVLRVINLLLLVLFATAFFVDYIVLKSVT